MKIGIIAFSQKGISLAEKIAPGFQCEAVLSGRDADRKKWTEDGFREKDALIYIGAAGIAIRSIAPHIKHKTEDPAVIVIDELGTFVIPVLSGHIGGANELAEEVAAYIGATPVITTATDINGVFAVDTWARRQGMKVLNPEKIKDVSSKLLSGKEIAIGCEDEIEGELPELVKQIKIADISRIDSDKPEKGYYSETETEGIGLLDEIDAIVSCGRLDYASSMGALMLVPEILTLGIGCRRGTKLETVERVFADFLEVSGIYKEAISVITSIDLKKDEVAITEFAKKLKLGFKTFSAEELGRVEGDFTASEFVKSTVGVDNVCERSAMYAAGEGAELIAAKFAREGVTFALAKKQFKPRW